MAKFYYELRKNNNSSSLFYRLAWKTLIHSYIQIRVVSYHNKVSRNL